MKKSLALKKQSPIKTVVVGVDHSHYSKLVVQQAEVLAQQCGAKLVLAHAADVTWFESDSSAHLTKVDLKQMKDSLVKFYELSPSAAVIEVERGFPAHVVMRIAKRWPSPLIVVGSQGKGGVSRFILGSNAEEIAFNSKVPVWVHRGRKLVPFKRVLVPTDLTRQSHKHIAEMKKWSSFLKMSMNFLYVKPKDLSELSFPQSQSQLISDQLRLNVNKALERFQKRAPGVTLSTISATDPSRKISRVGRDYDVIAMNPHIHPEMFHKFGRITSRVIRMSDRPVLVMKS